MMSVISQAMASCSPKHLLSKAMELSNKGRRLDEKNTPEISGA